MPSQRHRYLRIPLIKEPALTTITVSPTVLDCGRPYVEPDGSISGWQGDPQFLIRCDDLERGADAVDKAGERMMMINEYGRTVEHWETPGDTYTPNYFSGVYIIDAGLAIYLDCKGELSREMGEAMVLVLVQELTAAGVSAHIDGLGGNKLGSRHWIRPPVPTPSQPPQPDPVRRWYIGRTVACETTDWRGYEDHEWRKQDATWTWDRSEAESFTEPPNPLVKRLRSEENRPPFRGEVRVFRRPVDTSADEKDLPPREIRQRR